MLVRFRYPDTSTSWGWQASKGIQDLHAADPSLPASIREAIEHWDSLAPRIAEICKSAPTINSPVELLSPIDRPSKILCIGLNYRDHAIETNAPIPDEPIVFNKSINTLSGPTSPIVIPPISHEVDFEAELVVVVGKQLSRATESQASDAIFGYTAGNDVSARDWQKGKPGKQWFLGKSFDTFAPLGPAIALKSEIPNPSNLRIVSRLNGVTMQNSSTSELIFQPAMLLSYLSQVVTLEPGDLLFTGTPAGVGVARSPQVFLKPGDRIEVEIESIGILSNPCI